jgi:hypothetical protein
MTRGASTQLVLLYFAGWLKESAIGKDLICNARLILFFC